MTSRRIYFTDFFEVVPSDLESYGAFNVSLINDLPLFIDPLFIDPLFIGPREPPADDPPIRPAKGLLLATDEPWLNPPVVRLNVGRIPERGGTAAGRPAFAPRTAPRDGDTFT